MTEIIAASSDADLLSTVPALVGHVPVRSLVCVAFSGSRSCGALRLDLPARRDRTAVQNIASSAVALLSRTSADRVVPVLYTDETFAGAQGAPWWELERGLRRALRHAGFRVDTAFCVASDGWAGYPRHGADQAPRPLSALDRDAGRRAWRAHGDGPRTIAERVRLPVPAPGAVADVATLVQQLHEGRHRADGVLIAPGDRSDDGDSLDWVERRLAAYASRADEQARLLWLVRDPSARDAVLLQWAFGTAAGTAALAENRRWQDFHAAHDDAPSEDAVTTYLQSMTAASLDAADLLSGRSARRPDLGRVGRAIEILRDLAAVAPSALRPAPLTMLAWLSWCLGRSSEAQAYVAAARAIVPDYGLADLLDGMLSRGMLPEWAFSAASAAPRE